MTDLSGGVQKTAGTILVVESAVLVRMVLAEYLRGCAYKVLEAASYDEAMVILSEGDISIDVVFTDVDLPGVVNGFELARWIRANRPSIKVMLAGTIAKAADVAADLCDDGPIVTKPYDKKAVVDRIKRLIAVTDNQ